LRAFNSVCARHRARSQLVRVSLSSQLHRSVSGHPCSSSGDTGESKGVWACRREPHPLAGQPGRASALDPAMMRASMCAAGCPMDVACCSGTGPA
jgi:hypothetical protein